jgi:hypothetical protein
MYCGRVSAVEATDEHRAKVLAGIRGQCRAIVAVRSLTLPVGRSLTADSQAGALTSIGLLTYWS